MTNIRSKLSRHFGARVKEIGSILGQDGKKLKLVSGAHYQWDPVISRKIIAQNQNMREMKSCELKGIHNLLLLSIDPIFQDAHTLRLFVLILKRSPGLDLFDIARRSWKDEEGTKFSYTVYLKPGRILIKFKHRAPHEKSWTEKEVFWDISDVEQDRLDLSLIFNTPYLNDCKDLLLKCEEMSFAQKRVLMALDRLIMSHKKIAKTSRTKQ